MDKETMLDIYIHENFLDYCEPITPEDRKHIAESVGFARFCLYIAWEEFKKGIKGIFPFNLLFRRDKF